jgi:hypothetical protein
VREFEEEKIVVTPDDPAGFVDALEAARAEL